MRYHLAPAERPSSNNLQTINAREVCRKGNSPILLYSILILVHLMALFFALFFSSSSEDILGHPYWLSGKKHGDLGSIPGLGRSPGEGNDNPPQYSCLGNPMDREAWWATVQGVTKVRHDSTTKQQQ